MSPPIDPTPILRLTPGSLAERVLVVGDPKRAERVAEFLAEPSQLGHYREYLTIAGRYEGIPVAVSSHGVGGPGAAICFEELIRSGATRLLRAGTCGALVDRVGDGELIIATAAVRNDGVTDRLVPPAFPAVADGDLVGALSAAAAGTGRPVHRGMVLTEACFYSGPVLEPTLEMWRSAGSLAVEMECATLFVVALLRGVASAAVLTVDGHPLARDDADYDPHRTVVADGVDAMIRCALNALVAS